MERKRTSQPKKNKLVKRNMKLFIGETVPLEDKQYFVEYF